MPGDRVEALAGTKWTATSVTHVRTEWLGRGDYKHVYLLRRVLGCPHQVGDGEIRPRQTQTPT